VKNIVHFIAFLATTLLLAACSSAKSQATLGVVSAVDAQSLSAGIFALGAEQKTGY